MSIWWNDAQSPAGDSSPRRVLDGVIDSVLKTLLPQRCLVCKQHAGHRPVCPTCIANLPRLNAPNCPLCAHPHAPGVAGDIPCGSCLAHPPAFDATVAAFIYAAPIDQLVHSAKFHRRLPSADFLASELCALTPSLLAAHESAFTQSFTHLIPVPLSPARLAARGYNQSLELARPLERALAVPLDRHSLRRVRDTPAQSALHGKERRANLRAAFACDADLTGAQVLVTDDVITTGATLDAVARTLKAAGAVRVTNLVLARTLRANSATVLTQSPA
jgi:ComF family protein